MCTNFSSGNLGFLVSTNNTAGRCIGFDAMSDLWWGFRSLSSLGQGLVASIFTVEVIFSIALGIVGLILFALLTVNMQTYLQSSTARFREMRARRRDTEQWMHHRVLPQDLRERVRRYDQYKWQETCGVDEGSLIQSLPKDLRRDIKKHLCLDLMKKLPIFEDLKEGALEEICERLKPSLYTKNMYIVRAGDLVDEMLFIKNGSVECVTADGGSSIVLKEGDLCCEEVLAWATSYKYASTLQLSTHTVKALTEVEAFALTAEAAQFLLDEIEGKGLLQLIQLERRAEEARRDKRMSRTRGYCTCSETRNLYPF